MCGRFTLTVMDFDELASVLGAAYAPELAARHRPRYNVAPSDTHWIVQGHAGSPASASRVILPARWGFGDKRLPVVRSESAPRQFKRAFAEGRCLVPTDGFFEWSGEKGARTPHWFHPADGRSLLLLGGISGEGVDGFDFALLTTAPNATVQPVHDRMPVIIPFDEAERWLRGDVADAAPLLRPAANDLLIDTVVSARVNSARNDDPACLLPAAARTPAQGSLF